MTEIFIKKFILYNNPLNYPVMSEIDQLGTFEMSDFNKRAKKSSLKWVKLVNSIGFYWVFGYPKALTIKIAKSIFFDFIFFSSMDRSIHEDALLKSASTPLLIGSLQKNTKIAKIHWFQWIFTIETIDFNLLAQSCGSSKPGEWSWW